MPLGESLGSRLNLRPRRGASCHSLRRGYARRRASRRRRPRHSHAPWRIMRVSPEFASQTRSVLSELAERIRAPSGEKAQAVTARSCPSRIRSASPDFALQMRSVLSKLAERMRAPSGEKAQAVTARSCPSKVTRASPECASHSRSVLWRLSAKGSVLLRLADRIRAPSGEKAHIITVLSCAFSIARPSPEFASQTLSVVSSLADRIRAPSGEKAQAFTVPP